MLEIHKNYIFDKDNQPIAVQIPFPEFEQIEEILEDFGLIQQTKLAIFAIAGRSKN